MKDYSELFAAGFFAVVAFIGIILAITLAVSAVVWAGYNFIIQPLIPGAPHVGFWATWAILGVLRILALIVGDK